MEVSGWRKISCGCEGKGVCGRGRYCVKVSGKGGRYCVDVMGRVEVGKEGRYVGVRGRGGSGRMTKILCGYEWEEEKDTV